MIFGSIKQIFSKSFSKIKRNLNAGCTRCVCTKAHWWTGPVGEWDPPVSRTQAGLEVDRQELVVGEVTCDEVTSAGLPSTSRT
jgi:hypothetical protein